MIIPDRSRTTSSQAFRHASTGSSFSLPAATPKKALPSLSAKRSVMIVVAGVESGSYPVVIGQVVAR